MRKIVVYIATSADGFIARPDGSVDWLNRPRTAGDYGMGAFRRFVSEEPAAFAKRLRAKRGKNIWMMGGAALIGAFVDQDQIDEFIIHLIPTLIGEGIPLLGPGQRDVQLNLHACKQFSDGVVRLHYLVAKGDARSGQA